MIRDRGSTAPTLGVDPRAVGARAHPEVSGTVRVRRGTADDWDGVRRLVEIVHGVPRSAATLRWLYEANPAGRWLWVAEDVTTGQIVACRPVFPWRMRVGERVLVVRQAGDGMTHPERLASVPVPPPAAGTTRSRRGS